jgi:hypothetical protein
MDHFHEDRRVREIHKRKNKRVRTVSVAMHITHFPFPKRKKTKKQRDGTYREVPHRRSVLAVSS